MGESARVPPNKSLVNRHVLVDQLEPFKRKMQKVDNILHVWPIGFRSKDKVAAPWHQDSTIWFETKLKMQVNWKFFFKCCAEFVPC